jgi:hypothetical protein
VQLLVAFMYRELNGEGAQRASNYRWLTALHQAALGHAHGQQTLEALQNEVIAGVPLF